MPFKTRRQKLAAAQRRFTYSQTGQVTYTQETAREVSQSSSYQTVARVKPPEAIIENLGYVKSDLVKILIFATLIIGVQILLKFIRA